MLCRQEVLSGLKKDLWWQYSVNYYYFNSACFYYVVIHMENINQWGHSWYNNDRVIPQNTWE